MRFLTWLLGVMVVLLALEISRDELAGWTAVWITAAIVWFFAGAFSGLVALAKLTSGKVGAGGALRRAMQQPQAPAPHKEE
jgi:hypothetical protein